MMVESQNESNSFDQFILCAKWIIWYLFWCKMNHLMPFFGAKWIIWCLFSLLHFPQSRTIWVPSRMASDEHEARQAAAAGAGGGVDGRRGGREHDDVDDEPVGGEGREANRQGEGPEFRLLSFFSAENSGPAPKTDISWERKKQKWPTSSWSWAFVNEVSVLLSSFIWSQYKAN